MTTDPYRPLKDAYSRFGTGITIVTCIGIDGQPLGITVNSFTSVSLEPPLVLWCIDKETRIFDDFAKASHYGVSVLAAGQKDRSIHYATPNNHQVPDQHLDHGYDGTPLLAGRVAGFDCKIVNRVDAGDHVILIGAVEKFDSNGDAPLLYVNRKYGQPTDIIK